MHLAVGDAEHLPFEDNEFAMVMFSPPYLGQRTYDEDNIARKLDKWVPWMVSCITESVRVCKGPVVVVISGSGGANYEPAPELLLAEMYRTAIHVYRPCIWSKNAAPAGDKYFSNDWEYIQVYCKHPQPPIWNPTELRIPLKYDSGGHFRQRKKDGDRSKGSEYPTHKIRKRPSNVLDPEQLPSYLADIKSLQRVTVGGGHMGWKHATEYNEAPYPEKLVEPFVKVFTNPGDKVLDPFCGSGTTPCVADLLGRVGYGIDIRADQIEKAKLREDYIQAMIAQTLADHL